jgi:hypothetical protein
MNITKKMNFARLAYSHSPNLGDHIQTLATENFLKDYFINIERHELNQYKGEEVILLMQGYFFVNEYQCSFPPSNDILPVFVGFHIEDSEQTRTFYGTKEIIEYLKNYEPIGCRDDSTKNFLITHGINAYLTRCLTLTFPRRNKSIRGEKIFFVDAPEWLVPPRHSWLTGKRFNDIYKEAHFLTQRVDDEYAILPDEIKRQIAIDRINLLKNEAKLVVTSRLHIASPCIAMGIPVVLFPNRNLTRYYAINGIIPMHNPIKYINLFCRFNSAINQIIRRIIQILYIRFIINWSPIPPDIEKLKESIIIDVQNSIKRKQRNATIIR